MLVECLCELLQSLSYSRGGTARRARAVCEAVCLHSVTQVRRKLGARRMPVGRSLADGSQQNRIERRAGERRSRRRRRGKPGRDQERAGFAVHEGE
jgi:hypothetical protein